MAVSCVDVQAVSQQLAGAVTLLQAAVEAVPAHAVAEETPARLVRQVDAAWQRVAAINTKHTHVHLSILSAVFLVLAVFT